jgi:GxxExxY protein
MSTRWRGEGDEAESANSSSGSERGKVEREGSDSPRRHGDTEVAQRLVNGHLTARVIGAAIEVHRALGPGLLESAYQECLCRELVLRRVPFVRQFPLRAEYKGIRLDCSYRLDLLVESSLVVEIKSISAIEPVHEAQLLTYMRLGGWHVGILLNFNVARLKDGICRLVL